MKPKWIDWIFQLFEGKQLKVEPALESPFETAEYQQFVDSMVKHCRCTGCDRPCDGVLAGGMCDENHSDEQENFPEYGED